ncbi:ATP-grasp domain-containing protein [Bradyrhizobium sp. ISRA443]|uniref:ATP-binding protein n=1 Tax=unclassified Bradyrhizobium TaxID=2631580 RepID=UPI00247AD314|nr:MULTISPECIES: ATP-grasp domain-containing protein [unclassified Bradyrhizobium]WGR97928.1 ATP-grasp domain-containing protein [Bradyrhizobium sp. ISRA436]WGS04818.1 ATP-grasp domain-containing protein [Bradyrhizobium sp. ISRA437]WGS11698.1 ATP-grasp domain-containing protein [Bradyrhizobium sp. ISRA443]
MHKCSRLSPTSDIVGITSAQESVYATVGKLCRHFDLPRPKPAAIEVSRNKFAQCQFLAEADVPVPAYRRATNATKVESYAGGIGLPVIVKPAAGFGSSGVRLCPDADKLAEHTTYLLHEKCIWRSSPRMLVDEFAEGRHYSVEIIGNEVIGIGAVDFGCRPHFICREYIYRIVLTDDKHRRIVHVSLSCSQDLDVVRGPTNIDLRWTNLGPVVIGLDLRLAGTPNHLLIKLAYGIDLITEHIKLIIGEKCNLRRSRSDTAGARIPIPNRDEIRAAISSDNRAAAALGVTEIKFSIEPKSPIVRTGDYRDKIGYIIAPSPDLGRTKAILQCAADSIDWRPFPTQGKPGNNKLASLHCNFAQLVQGLRATLPAIKAVR